MHKAPGGASMHLTKTIASEVLDKMFKELNLEKQSIFRFQIDLHWNLNLEKLLKILAEKNRTKKEKKEAISRILIQTFNLAEKNFLNAFIDLKQLKTELIKAKIPKENIEKILEKKREQKYASEKKILEARTAGHAMIEAYSGLKNIVKLLEALIIKRNLIERHVEELINFLIERNIEWQE